jgi:DNA polymerase III alpha subunit (gram-positive type)
MKSYVSIDTETTGLDRDNHMLLEVGAVIDDWVTPIDELPTFHCYVDHAEDLVGSPYALSMHPTILRRIATHEEGWDYLEPDCVAGLFDEWLMENGIDSDQHHITAAGKNFDSFDRQFLRRLPYWQANVKTQHRSIDPGNLYWDPRIDLQGLPDLKTCMERAGIQGEVAHNAVDDAIVVVKLVRHWFENR